ncbi:hypothetical protein C2I17_21070 [Niallia circulans]|uniref:hypothetical protein n=1 Tax=Niallia circulans TaxID=1397 RepID=UPI00201DFB9E|nr:hypothetical protein [Niallia circulans]UQZ76834.1 hypothetical protein C2I17_21070 [Niallia circulans]
MKNDNFVFLLGIGFVGAAMCGLIFSIDSSIILGLTIFGFCLALSDYFTIPLREGEETSFDQLNKTKIVFKVIQYAFVVGSIPLAIGLPLLINDLFANPEEAYSQFSNYIAIFSIGLSLMMRKKYR